MANGELVRAAVAVIAAMISLQAGAAEYVFKEHVVWIPDSIKSGEFVGAIVHRNYGGQKKQFYDEEWRVFAEKNKLVQVLLAPQNGVDQKDDVSELVGRKDVKRMEDALANAEKESGISGLKNLPFLPIGISRGGANSLCMANSDKGRAIAAIVHHAQSAIGISPNDIPVLYTQASADSTEKGTGVWRNVDIDKWLKKTIGRNKVFWTSYMHVGFGHGSSGDNEFSLLWIKSILDLRLNGSKLKQMPGKGDYYWGKYKMIDGNTTDAKYTDVSLSQKNSEGSSWLPSKEIAELWEKNVKKNSKQ